MGLRVVDRADEYDRRRFGTLTPTDERRRLEAVHHGHVYVEQDDGEILPKQTTKCFLTRSGANEILVQLGQDGFVCEQLVGPVVDNKDADLFVGQLLWDGIRSHV